MILVYGFESFALEAMGFAAELSAVLDKLHR